MINTNICCNNCGKQGHSFNQCKQPIISCGIVLCCKDNSNQWKYLMIRRKNSFGFIDFMRGKYQLNNLEHLQCTFDEMSNDEKQYIIADSFDELWIKMWGCSTSPYKTDELLSKKKFEALKTLDTLNNLVSNSQTSWDDPEWEFPKGRRNCQEKDLCCALREFEEETGIPKNSIVLVENMCPFEEIFIGSNYKSYKHKYFIAIYPNPIEDLNLENFQRSEVSKIEFKTMDECMDCIRPYSLEKRRLIKTIHQILTQYKIS